MSFNTCLKISQAIVYHLLFVLICFQHLPMNKNCSIKCQLPDCLTSSLMIVEVPTETCPTSCCSSTYVPMNYSHVLSTPRRPPPPLPRLPCLPDSSFACRCAGRRNLILYWIYSTCPGRDCERDWKLCT